MGRSSLRATLATASLTGPSRAERHLTLRVCASFDALDEIRERGEAQAVREDDHRVEPGGSEATLEQAHLGSMQIALARERLLRDVRGFAQAAQVPGEPLTYLLC